MVDEQKPSHVAVILDGNRRFAKKLMAKPWKGHEWGRKRAEELLKWCKEFDIPELTLYVFSLQNFDRPKDEFDYIMRLFVDTYRSFLDERSEDFERIRVRFIGRVHLFPQEVRDAIRAVEEKTAANGPYRLNVAMAYGGREEITDAVRAIAVRVKAGELAPEDVDEKVISASLSLRSEPDLIIRTGGDHRTSNFLIWQSWYSEWFFVEKTWPEFGREDFEACLRDFSARERRFGK